MYFRNRKKNKLEVSVPFCVCNMDRNCPLHHERSKHTTNSPCFHVRVRSDGIPLLFGIICCTEVLSFLCPHGLAFTWWGCYGLCLRHKTAELAHSFLFCSCVFLCLYGPFNCILCHTFSRQLAVFSLCFFPVLSLPYWSFQLTCLFMKVSPIVVDWA